MKFEIGFRIETQYHIRNLDIRGLICLLAAIAVIEVYYYITAQGNPLITMI